MPTLPETAVAPLAVLAEEWPLRDALILTFNSNLGFFEKSVLGRLRARGARVTVVSDADMVHADPYAVRFPGRSYLDGRALCLNGGAFHPKLIVTVSDEQAAVLIGSGNASPGGWINNAELWTVLRATTEEGPGAIGQTAVFLEALPSHVRFTPGVEDVLAQVATALRAFPSTQPGPALVSTVTGPILEQLPAPDDVRRLLIAAPFHDRAAKATLALHDRLRPDSTEVLVQAATVFDGARLKDVLDRFGGTTASITDRRYHHGKLIEWHTADGVTALTGSPNASGAALLKGLSDGGNCELGLVAAVDGSLRPATGDSESAAAVAGHEWKPPQDSAGQAPVTLLAAVLTAEGIRLVLRRPFDEAMRLEMLADDRWELLDMVPAAVVEHVVTVRVPGASAVRLVDPAGAASNVVWVTDLARTGFRSVGSKRKMPREPLDMVLDPSLVRIVEEALASVRSWASDATGPAPAAAPSTGSGTAKRESWQDYVDSFREEMGDDFSFFVLPHLMRAAGAEPSRPTPDPGEESEDAEQADAEQADAEQADDPIEDRLAALHDDDRMVARLRSYRRMCEKLNKVDERPAPVLIAATTLTIGGAALGCWDDKTAMARELRRSLRHLAPVAGDDTFATDAANIAAVGLAVLRSHVRTIASSDELTMQYRQAAKKVRDLLRHSTESGIADRAAGLVAAVYGPAVTTARITGLVESVVAPDHVAIAAEVLYVEYDSVTDVEDVCIRIVDDVPGDPSAAVLRAVGLAQDAPVVGATARGPKGAAAASWRSPLLALVRRNPKARRVTLYRLDGWAKLNDYARTGVVPSELEQGNWYGDDVPEAVEELLIDGGILLDDV